jgi:cell wall-associated NlpC family hydrolase
MDKRDDISTKHNQSDKTIVNRTSSKYQKTTAPTTMTGKSNVEQAQAEWDRKMSGRPNELVERTSTSPTTQDMNRRNSNSCVLLEKFHEDNGGLNPTSKVVSYPISGGAKITNPMSYNEPHSQGGSSGYKIYKNETPTMAREVNSMNTLSIAYGGKRRVATNDIMTTGIVTSDEMLLDYLPKGAKLHEYFISNSAASCQAVSRRTYEIQKIDSEINKIKSNNDWQNQKELVEKVQKFETQKNNLVQVNNEINKAKIRPFDKNNQYSWTNTHKDKDRNMSQELMGHDNSIYVAPKNYAQLKARNVGNHIKYTVSGATEKSIKSVGMLVSRQLYSTGSESDKGVSLVINGAMVTKALASAAANHYIGSRYEKMMDRHLGILIKMDNLSGTGMEHVKISKVKDTMNQLGLKFNGVDSPDGLRAYAQSMLSKAKNGKVTLTKEQTVFLTNLAKSLNVKPEERIKLLEKVLADKYKISFSHVKGLNGIAQMEKEIKKILRDYKLKGIEPPPNLKEMMEELLELKKGMYGKAQKRSAKGKNRALITRMMNNFVMNPLRRSMGEAGQGLAQTTEIVSMGIRTGIMGIKIIQKANSLMAQQIVRLTSRLAQLIGAIGKLTEKAARAVGANAVANSINTAGNVFRGAKNTVLNAKGKVNNVRNKLGNTRDRIINKIKDPFGLKAKLKNKISQAWKNFLSRHNRLNQILTFFNNKFKFIGGIKDKLAEIGQAIQRAIAALLRPFLIIIAILFLITAGVLVINSGGLTAILSAFNLGSQEYDTKELIVDHIASLYQDDFTAISQEIDAKATYEVNEKTIEYVDYKDTDKYSEIKSEADDDVEDFTQSSNCGEILAMALVKYNFDFGTAKDRVILGGLKESDRYKEVKSYVTSLWYGSHYIKIDEDIIQKQTGSEEVTATDRDGNIIYNADGSVKTETNYTYTSYSNITVQYQTTYFDGLFTCALADSRQIYWGSTTELVTSYNGITGNASYKSVYYWLRYYGVSHEGACAVIGNLASEVGGCSVTEDGGILLYLDGVVDTDGKIHRGICMWSPGRWQNLLNYCGSSGEEAYYTIRGQIKFLVHEMKTSYNSVYTNSLMKADDDTIEDRAYDIAANYEVCATSYREARKEYAKTADSIFKKYKDTWEDDLSESVDGATAVVEYALQFVGNKYVYGGTSLTNGIDCSHFVYQVYKDCGYNVSYYSTSVFASSCKYATYIGTKLSNAIPGDILLFPGHIGIYMGNNQMVHASNSKPYPAGGIKTSDNISSSYTILGIYRVKQ